MLASASTANCLFAQLQVNFCAALNCRFLCCVRERFWYAPQTYLEQNEGPGLQHLALKTDDVLGAVRKMRRVSGCGGFDFMPPASAKYYKCDWALDLTLGGHQNVYYSVTLICTLAGDVE